MTGVVGHARLHIAIRSPSASSQVIEHGTYFVAEFSADYGIVAIDSRLVKGLAADDQHCKILPLSHNAFFFARGLVTASSNVTGSSVFDAHSVARDVYGRFGAGNANLAGVAQAWATQMTAIYNSNPWVFGRAAAADGNMADGFFVGEDAAGRIVFSSQHISYQPSRFPAFMNEPNPVIYGETADLPAYASGHQEIIWEFHPGSETERARTVLAQIGPVPAGPEGVAARYSAYVAAVRDWANDSGIGGDIATVIIERSKGWRWFHRPDFCPDN